MVKRSRRESDNMRVHTAPQRAIIGVLGLVLLGGLTACAPSSAPNPGGNPGPGTSNGSESGEPGADDQEPTGSSACHFEFQIDGHTIDSSMPPGGKNQAQVVYEVDSSTGALEAIKFYGADDSSFVQMEFPEGPTGPGSIQPLILFFEFDHDGETLMYDEYFGDSVPGTLTAFDHPRTLSGDLSGTVTRGIGPNTESVEFTATFSSADPREGIGGFRCYAP